MRKGGEARKGGRGKGDGRSFMPLYILRGHLNYWLSFAAMSAGLRRDYFTVGWRPSSLLGPGSAACGWRLSSLLGPGMTLLWQNDTLLIVFGISLSD